MQKDLIIRKMGLELLNYGFPAMFAWSQKRMVPQQVLEYPDE
ncbi:hypothetical protein [Flavobacterium sp.]